MIRRAPARPRARSHPFRRDWSVAPDHRGELTCTCGSKYAASNHRIPPRQSDGPDARQRAAGERDESDVGAAAVGELLDDVRVDTGPRRTCGRAVALLVTCAVGLGLALGAFTVATLIVWMWVTQ